jgi:signal transduction histidine kinase/CheY-like chemotaxis protein
MGASDVIGHDESWRIVAITRRELELARRLRESVSLEQDLERSEATAKALLAIVPHAILTIRGDGVCLDLGGEPDTVSILETDRVVGKHISEVFPSSVVGPVTRGVARTVESRNVHEQELEPSETGDQRYYVARFAPRVEGEVVVVIQDLTERRRVEQQIRTAQRMEAVGRLAGGIAHDFNNLLTIIGSYADILQATAGEGHPWKADLGMIQDSVKRAAALTDQLLAFSRRKVQKLDILSLNEVVGGVETMLRRLIGEDIELRIRLDEELATVSADATQMEQVLMNLAVNARDAMPTGGKLTIETANVTLDEPYGHMKPAVIEPGPYAMVAVSDNGVGMEPEVREKIFEPFFTTKREGHGTGLGLATVYGIVKQSNGFVWVYSEPGQGTTFKIYLPTAEGTGKENRADEPTSETSSRAGSETILLVEDQPIVRKVARRILEEAGYEVLEAAEGSEALDIAASRGSSIQLLLTDVVMPKMNGRELADEIASRTKHLRVLFMSGYTHDAIAHHGVLEEGISYLQKPFTADLLLDKVRSTLDRSSEW